jgi:hypothetical protein
LLAPWIVLLTLPGRPGAFTTLRATTAATLPALSATAIATASSALAPGAANATRYDPVLGDRLPIRSHHGASDAELLDESDLDPRRLRGLNRLLVLVNEMLVSNLEPHGRRQALENEAAIVLGASANLVPGQHLELPQLSLKLGPLRIDAAR